MISYFCCCRGGSFRSRASHPCKTINTSPAHCETHHVSPRSAQRAFFVLSFYAPPQPLSLKNCNMSLLFCRCEELEAREGPAVLPQGPPPSGDNDAQLPKPGDGGGEPPWSVGCGGGKARAGRGEEEGGRRWRTPPPCGGCPAAVTASSLTPPRPGLGLRLGVGGRSETSLVDGRGDSHGQRSAARAATGRALGPSGDAAMAMT